MATPRKELINLDATTYYHVVSRCVRRTYLCGVDTETGRDYIYRKQWLVDRMKHLAEIFAIDIAAYAVMSNHYHMVLHVDKKRALSWSDNEVFERCKVLYPNKARELEQEIEKNPEAPIVIATLASWRARLFDISWFMRNLNEPIAKRANLEEDCKGHFWEGRFKSQALLDEGAVLSAMAYVDLNPIRAAVSSTPEESEFTSIKERIDALTRSKIKQSKSAKQPSSLMSFEEPSERNTTRLRIPFNLLSYIKLLDETGRMIRHDKKGAISKSLSPILARLNLCPDAWTEITQKIESNFAYVIGSSDELLTFNSRNRIPKGTAYSRRMYLKYAGGSGAFKRALSKIVVENT